MMNAAGRALPLMRRQLQVGAGVEQGGGGSKVQRGPSIVVPRVQAGTIGEQGNDCLVVASGGGFVQGGANSCLYRRGSRMLRISL